MKRVSREGQKPAGDRADRVESDPSAKEPGVGAVPGLESKEPGESKGPVWSMLYFISKGIGAFLVGITAGYAFAKAEERFAKYGENVFFQFLGTIRKGQGFHAERTRSYGAPGFSHRGQRPPYGADDDTLGEGGGEDLDDQI